MFTFLDTENTINQIVQTEMSSTELKQQVFIIAYGLSKQLLICTFNIQDTVTKRKLLLRSDAVVGDDDNKVKPIPPKYEPFMRRSSTASHQSKGITSLI